MYYFCNTLTNLKPHNVRITILQTDIKWACPEGNMMEAEALIGNAPTSDVYVLPEMWATGFVAKTPETAYDEAPLEWMKTMAGKLDAALCGSLVAKEIDGSYRNRLYFVLPDGGFYYYDKHHLFTYGRENEHYTQGNKRVIAKYKNVRFMLQTCYDLRFPVWVRNNADYDAIIFTANWPQSRQNVWQILLRARAIENQCYVIGANRTGNDPQCTYIGNSAIIDAKGATLAQAKGHVAQAVTAEIDIIQLELFRLKFPVLNDRDLIRNN